MSDGNKMKPMTREQIEKLGAAVEVLCQFDRLTQEVEQLRKELEEAKAYGRTMFQRGRDSVEFPLCACNMPEVNGDNEMLEPCMFHLEWAEKHPLNQDDWCRTVEHKNLELSAYVNRLRDVLRDATHPSCNMGKLINDAAKVLSEQPSASLKEYQDKVIEMCAEKCDFIAKVLGDIPAGRQSQHNAKAIRNLKGEGDE